MGEMSNALPQGDVTAGGQTKVEIYTTRHCGYCVRAKQLLASKGLAYVEYGVDGSDESRLRMMERTGGRRSVPQIFINDQGIGGYLELLQMERAGELDALLKRQEKGNSA